MSNVLPREAFLNDPRCNELRDLCLALARSVDRLLHFPEAKKEEEYTIILQIDERFDQMGILESMNVGLSEETYKENPVVFMEYIAGQWKNVLHEEKEVKSEKDILPITQEFSEFSTPQVKVLSGEYVRNSLPLQNFIMMRSFVNITFHWTDANEEESHSY